MLKKLPFILLVLLLITPVFLSCARPPNIYVINPVVVTDGAGGFIVAYQVNRQKGPITYLARLGPEGNTIWDSVRLDRDQPTEPISPTELLSDGKGNTVVIWGLEHKLNPWEYFARIFDWAGLFLWSPRHDIWAQKIDKDGHFLWPRKVKVGESHILYKLKALSTNGGESIIGWYGVQGNLFLQKVSNEGKLLWPRKARIPTAVAFDMQLDRAGNLLIASVTRDHAFSIEKLDLTARTIWSSPLVVSDVDTSKKAYAAQYTLWLVAGEEGGCIAAFTQFGSAQVFIQKINAEGVSLWSRSSPGSGSSSSVVSDGSGGVFIFRLVATGGKYGSVMVRRINSHGDEAVGDSDIDRNVFGYDAAPDGSGGAIVVWRRVVQRQGVHEDFFPVIQRLDHEGRKLWNDGVVLTDAPPMPRITPDGSGGFIVSFIRRVLRIAADGKQVWRADLEVNPTQK